MSEWREVKDGSTEASLLSAVLTVGTQRILVVPRADAHWEGWSACMHGDWLFFPNGKVTKDPPYQPQHSLWKP